MINTFCWHSQTDRQTGQHQHWEKLTEEKKYGEEVDVTISYNLEPLDSVLM